MSIRALPGQFPPLINAPPLVLADTTSVGALAPFQGNKTQGGFVASVPAISVQDNSRWKLLSVAFAAQLLMLNPVSCYGRLGKLKAGVVETNSAISLQSTPNFPLDTSLWVTLWDGETDEPPPSVSTPPIRVPDPATTLVVTGEVALQLPKEILPGAGIGLGIWLTSSLLASSVTAFTGHAAGLLVPWATFMLTVDDGV